MGRGCLIFGILITLLFPGLVWGDCHMSIQPIAITANQNYDPEDGRFYNESSQLVIRGIRMTRHQYPHYDCSLYGKHFATNSSNESCVLACVVSSGSGLPFWPGLSLGAVRPTLGWWEWRTLCCPSWSKSERKRETARFGRRPNVVNCVVVVVWEERRGLAPVS